MYRSHLVQRRGLCQKSMQKITPRPVAGATNINSFPNQMGVASVEPRSPRLAGIFTLNQQTMAAKNKKQFGIWMDSHQAIIVGRDKTDSGGFVVLAHEKSAGREANSNENTGNNAERKAQLKFFKDIASHMQNAEELHVTGTGQIQEQFIHFMAETPQFKNTVSNESTTQQMSEEKLLEYMTKTFH